MLAKYTIGGRTFMNKQRAELIKDIYNSLQDKEIVRGDQIFSERELCEKFQVKRSVLREALIALETLGIIEIRERQGMFVGKGNEKALADGLDFLSGYSPVIIHDQSMEVRLMVEPKAAALAARNLTEKHCVALKEELTLVEQLKQQTDSEEKYSLDYQHNVIIHNIIVDAADNMVLTEIYKYLSSLSRNVFSILGNSALNFHPYALWPDVLHSEHEHIVNAIILQDEKMAEDEMRKHLENSLRRNKEIIKKHGGVGSFTSQLSALEHN